MIKIKYNTESTKQPSVVIMDGANLNIMVGKGISSLINYIVFLYKKFLPTKMIIVFEGKNSLDRRRARYPQYKKKTLYHYTSLDIETLSNLPIHVVTSSKMESDDVISLIVEHFLDDYKKIIVSTDRDYYQLFHDNPDLSIYNPITKETITYGGFIDLYEFPPHLFTYCKAIVGDKSDNISGVSGWGMKRFLSLLDDNRVKQMIDECERDDDWFYDKVKDFISLADWYNLLYVIRIPNIDMYSATAINNIKDCISQPLSLNASNVIKVCGDGVKREELVKLISLK